MRSIIQKLISVFLCMTLLCSALAFVGKAEENETDNEDYPYLYLDNRSLGCSVLVVSYDLTYEKLGSEPTATLSYTQMSPESEESEPQSEECALSIEPQSIRRELFRGDDGCLHPQLFICLPDYFGLFPQSALLTVGAGAYQSADGTPSPAVELQFSQFAKRQIGVCFLSDKVTILHHILAKTDINVYMSHWFEDDYISLWDKNAVFYLDDVPITTKNGFGTCYAKVPNRGEHAVRMQLNDFVFTDELHFYAVSRMEARREQFDELGRVSIGQGAVNMLLSVPLMIAPFVAIPSFFAGMLSVGDGLGCMFLSTFLLYLHTDRFFNGGVVGHLVYGGQLYQFSHWTFS